MAEFPALPLWTDAYLADLHPKLSLEEHGCMILLMQFAWRSPNCQFRDDDRFIARMLGVHTNRWRARLRPVMEEMWTVENGQWSQKRLQKEWGYVRGVRAKRIESGRRGGLAKSRKNNKPALASLDICSSPAVAPTPTPTPKEEKKERKTRARKGALCPVDFVPNEKHFERGEKKGLGREEVTALGEAMINWSHANANQAKAYKACWDRTLNGFIDREDGRASANGGPTPQQQQRKDFFDDLNEKLDRRIQDAEREPHQTLLECHDEDLGQLSGTESGDPEGLSARRH